MISRVDQILTFLVINDEIEPSFDFPPQNSR